MLAILQNIKEDIGSPMHHLMGDKITMTQDIDIDIDR